MGLSVRFLVAQILIASAALAFPGSHPPKNSWTNSAKANSSTANETPENCLSIADAQKHIGKSNCITGTVVQVEQATNGVTYLDFCPDYHSCPFTVVVFRSDLRSVGDVRQLQGRTISIKGRIEEYDDRAEIILRHPQQLGENGKLIAVPKDYDIERQGHYSVGTFRAAKSKKTRRKSEGAPISIEDPEEP
ncbi:MAG TPA: hypothetical protein VL983_06460 [Terriglobales bacterium]|nr:hypothetical protein [Terriglobales bacterium]